MKHLTSDELVDRLYGIGATDHLSNCADCTDRFLELQQRREMAAEALPESHEFLAAQRRNIYARMGERPQNRMKWVPALAAAACLVAVGVVAHHPAPFAERQIVKPEIVVEQHDDGQLFSEVYSMEQSMEPIAAMPIHAVFEQDAQ
jgi:hypothetical protein